MILALSEKFLFIHVYKVAGTSITHALGELDFRRALRRLLPKTLDLYLRSHGVNPRATWLNDHAFAKDVRAMMRPQLFQSLYKVGFVRNPWDLQLSLYKYNIKYPEHRNSKRDFDSFESFIMSAPIDEFPTGQQKRFLFDDDGNQLVDFIGRYENLETDFGRVCGAIGKEGVKLEHRNSTQHEHWKAYYSRRMFDRVRRYAQPDIETFGYADEPAAYAIH